MKLNIAGRAPIYLPRDPLEPLEAATKQYVDTGISTHASNANLHLTSSQNTWLDAITVTSTEVNSLSGISSNVQSQIDSKLDLTGGVLTGSLTLANDPATGLEASTKNYTDLGLALKVNKAGDTMTGALILHAAPSADLQASTKKYVDDGIASHASNNALHLTPSQNTWLDAVTVTSSEVNLLEGVVSSVQEQLNSKLALAGGTMTGDIVLAGAPTANLHPSTKQYTDSGLATKLNLSGGVMTGHIKLVGDPVADEDAVRKAYLNTQLAAHDSDDSKHLTSSQNTWLDAITVTSTEVNSLSGISSNVQSQIDSKFNKSGGTVTGDITLTTGKTIYLDRMPESDNEVVTKGFVLNAVQAKKYEDPISASNLLSTTLSEPPLSPSKGATYIVAATATGDWLGKEGMAVTYNGTSWDNLQSRLVEVGDRFGVALTSGTPPTEELSALRYKLVTVTSISSGTYVFTVDPTAAGSTTMVFDNTATDFGASYTYTDEGFWIVTNTSVNLRAGGGLNLEGNTISVATGNGIELDGGNSVAMKLNPECGLGFDNNSALELKYNHADFRQLSGELSLSELVLTSIDDRVSKSTATTVTGTINVTGGITYSKAPVGDTDLANKLYVDTRDSNLQTQISSVSSNLTTLTSTVDTLTNGTSTALDTKVNKAGDTMTGALILHAAPTTNLQASTKKYVDDGIASHASDDALHLTSSQNTWLDAIIVTASEVNTLSGATGNLQVSVDSKLSKSGGTMTGDILLAGVTTEATGAITKGYTDAGLALKVNKAGDIMTGFLELHAGPSGDMHASTKKYVDDGIASHASNNALHLTPSQNTWLDAITVTSSEVNSLSGVVSNVQALLNSKLALAGGTMTGDIVLAGAPTANLHPSTKQYTDSGLATKLNLSGGVMTGDLVLNGLPSSSDRAANKEYVDIEVTSAKDYTDTGLATKVNKAGDTMTGALMLHAAPSADLQASTKKYVDDSTASLNSSLQGSLTTISNDIDALTGQVDGLLVDPVTKFYVDTQDNTKLAKSGGAMSGYITLHADPLNPLHPASKQYVDNLAQGLVAKERVRLATTSNLDATYSNGSFGVNATLTGNTNGALLVDGKVPGVGDRILVRVQSSAYENGDYGVQQVGDTNTPYILKRAVTLDESSEVPGSYFFVYDGATLKATGWALTVTNPVTFAIGTDDIAVNQFNGPGSVIGGAGIVIDGNTINIQTANPGRIVVNADNIDLAATGVTPGSYTKVVTDGYGRITSGSNPNTLAGYGIADAQSLNANLTSLSNVTAGGLLVRTTTGDVAARPLEVSGIGLSITNDGSGEPSTPITIGSNATSASSFGTIVSRDSSGNFSANIITADVSGNSDTATRLKNSRDFSITGDITATSVAFTGLGNVELNAILANVGITPGDYTKVVVNAKGQVVSGSNPTTLSGYGIVDAYTKTEVDAKIAALESIISDLQAYVMSKI